MPVTTEDTKANIIILLRTCPHPCRLRKLLRDYRRMKGHNMPLFGFSNHIELLKSFTDIIVVVDPEHDRNPEIRLLRKDTRCIRPRNSLSGISDDRAQSNEQKLHNVTQSSAPILQDEAAAYHLPPEEAANKNEGRENFVLIDDGIGEGREEEEHLESLWDMETELSLSFFIDFCMRWMIDFIKIIWRKFIQIMGWSTNSN